MVSQWMSLWLVQASFTLGLKTTVLNMTCEVLGNLVLTYLYSHLLYPVDWPILWPGSLAFLHKVLFLLCGALLPPIYPGYWLPSVSG